MQTEWVPGEAEQPWKRRQEQLITNISDHTDDDDDDGDDDNVYDSVDDDDDDGANFRGHPERVVGSPP